MARTKNRNSQALASEESLLKALNDMEGRAQEEESELDGVSRRVSKSMKKKGMPPPPPARDEDSEDESSDDDDESGEMEERSMGKSHTASKPGMPDDTDEANGGLAGQAGRANDDFESIDADDYDDPTNASVKRPSMKSLVNESAAIKKGVDVSEFLEAMVDTTTTAIDGSTRYNAAQWAEQKKFNQKLSKALVSIADLLLQRGSAQAEEEEDAPVARPRSVQKSMGTVERFQKSATEGPQYTRQQTLDAMIELASKGNLDPLAVSAYEATGEVRTDYVGVINQQLAKMFP